MTRLADSRLRGMKESEIAEELGVTQQQISYDLGDLRRRWAESSVRNFEKARSEQLARIDLVETEARSPFL